jgi:hypothetical protein
VPRASAPSKGATFNDHVRPLQGRGQCRHLTWAFTPGYTLCALRAHEISESKLNPKLPEVMVEMFVLCLAPLFAGERTEKAVNVAVGSAFAQRMKMIYKIA